MTTEPEITAADGTVRKAHYGEGRQPWDDIKAAGWAPAFSAGNVLKYVRRAAAKNGEDDLKKARWYAAELAKLQGTLTGKMAYAQLVEMLTADELALVSL